jgi:hypothetical protein
VKQSPESRLLLWKERTGRRGDRSGVMKHSVGARHVDLAETLRRSYHTRQAGCGVWQGRRAVEGQRESVGRLAQVAWSSSLRNQTVGSRNVAMINS